MRSGEKNYKPLITALTSMKIDTTDATTGDPWDVYLDSADALRIITTLERVSGRSLL
jgi:acyl carrier protein